jgi:adenine/guanine phosphoribosyltransferase-like PRPP-binding protein
LTASSILISRHNQLASAVAPASLPKQSPAETDLWIFRDGKKSVSGPELVRELRRRVSSPSCSLDALIQAGQLEAALFDAGSACAGAASKLTDSLAYLAVSGEAEPGFSPDQLMQKVKAPDSIEITPPEGFTYYALHPLDFAHVVEKIPKADSYAVVGIRSIGTTLSAVTAAGLRARGDSATRLTVRPTGHPYSRATEFTSEQIEWIHEHLSRSSKFLVVDEGPGRSGSTFLSVAEALVRAGVPASAINLIGSRQFDPQALCANEAASRWRLFRFQAVTVSVSDRFSGYIYVGGGDWRRHFFGDDSGRWPESWTQMERLKFLSSDRRSFLKFEGIGPIGTEARERAFVLADASFSPSVSDAGNGFLAYDALSERPLHIGDLSASVLERIAEYCAFRVSHFSARPSSPDELQKMLEFNVQQEFGRDFELNSAQLNSNDLVSASPIVVDGRMQPYEWISTGEGKVLKTDAISHGDNHFFPGPCDIAWDLAGAAIEWRLEPDAVEFLLNRFRQLSGIDAQSRISIHMLAYCVFRLGFCKMALPTVCGSAEEQRLEKAYRYYRGKAEQLLFKHQSSLRAA